jgi:hypothetical protein
MKLKIKGGVLYLISKIEVKYHKVDCWIVAAGVEISF